MLPALRRRLLLLLDSTSMLTSCASVIRSADRDLVAFAGFVATGAVFIDSGNPLRGKEAIVAHWKKHYMKPQALFSWKSELVEVPESGSLGYSEGPVSAPDGTAFARYYST